MAGSAARFRFQRGLCREVVTAGRVDQVDADEVRAQVIDQDVAAGRVEKGFVGMGSFLARRDGSGRRESVGEDLERGEAAGGGRVVGLKGGAGTVW